MEKGIEALAKPIFVRGVSPFNGWHASCLLLWPAHLAPLSMVGAPLAWLVGLVPDSRFFIYVYH